MGSGAVPMAVVSSHYMYRLANIGDTGDPMAVLNFCRYMVPLKPAATDNQVAAQL